jgi:translocation and assembly module TamB
MPVRALRIIGIILLLPIVLIAALLIAANTSPGQRFIESETASLTGGQVILTGLSGRFPDALRLAHAELRDAKGPWLQLDNIVLNWSPLALIHRDAHVTLLQAAHIAVTRLPAASPAKPQQSTQTGFTLPVGIDLDALHIGRLELGAPVALKPAALSIDGTAHIKTLQQAQANIAIARIGGAGAYTLAATLNGDAINAHLTANEPPGGLISGIANLPDLGAIALDATMNGPRTAELTHLSLTAGQLQATAQGTVNITGQSAALDLTASAPAMAPRPDLSWASIALQAHIQGPFKKPGITAHATLRQVKGGGASIQTLTLDASGNRGAVNADTILAGLIIPGARPDLFSASPLEFTLQARLDDPKIPITFALKHPLVTADGTANAGGDIAAKIHTTVPDLAPLAALGKVDLQGRTEADAAMAVHGDTTSVTLDGTADFTGGQAPVPTLLGHTTYGATATLTGQDIAISRATVDGTAAHIAVTGTDTNKGLDLAWKLALSDLKALAAQARGSLDASGTVQGPQTGLAVQAGIKGRVGTATIPEGPLALSLNATNLPSSPSGTVQATGSFAGAPVTLDATLDKDQAGAFHAVLKRAGWKSLAAQADLTLPKGATFPEGMLTARMSRLADLQPILRQPVAGAFTAKLATTGGARPEAKLNLEATSLAAGNAAIGRLVLTGTVRDPISKTPDLAVSLAATNINAPHAEGTAHVTATGPLSALAIRADTNLLADNAPATLTTQALLDASISRVTLQTLAVTYKGETLRLDAPARITYGAQTAVDRLRLALGPATAAANAATLDIAGQVAPALDLTASLRNVTPNLAKPFAPTLNATGTLAVDARLTGTTAAPHGTIRLQAAGLRLRTGPAASLPPGTIQANLALTGAAAQIDARIAAGPKLHFAANGTAPLGQGALSLHTTGGLDLSLLNPILNADGRRAAGTIALNATIAGTTAAPQIQGGVTLTRGEVQDFVQGLRITDIAARITGAGNTVTVQNVSGRAGPGTLNLTGTIGVAAPGLPVDLHFTASNARPLASDLLTAWLDADVAINGPATGNLQVGGKIFLRHAEINIPNGLPPSVATLNVRYPGQKPPPPAPAAPPAEIHLALTVDAPSNVFVRGHGLDSELGGKLTIAGTAAAPQIAGGFDMRRGDIGVAGTTLTFSHGRVGFDGTSVTNKIDPTLDFVADSTSGGVTATLTVGGYADAPKITLSSVPDLPQDEVLAHLLFQRSVKDLSTVQIAEIAAALAELSGVTGGGGDPLAAVRRGLGLDRLSVGSGTGTSNGATVEAGRYVARGVFVGAKQNTSGGTAAEVQIDLTKRLKLTSQLATGGGSVQGATPDNDPGSTIGLSYGFDY